MDEAYVSHGAVVAPSSAAPSDDASDHNQQQQQQQHQQQQQQFASAPACLLAADVQATSAALDALKDSRASSFPRGATAEEHGSSATASSEGKRARPGPNVGQSASSSRVGGGGGSCGARRMPGMVKKSLQEQELRGLLEVVTKKSTSPQPQSQSQSHSSEDITMSEAFSADLGGGGGDGQGKEARSRGLSFNDATSPLDSCNNAACDSDSNASVAGAGAARLERNVSGGSSSGMAVFAEGVGGGAGGGGGHEAEAHPVLELYRSIDEPLDQLSFEELKRRVKGAIEEDGAGPASMTRLVDFLGMLKRFSEDQLQRLKERYAQPETETDADEEGVFGEDEDGGGDGLVKGEMAVEDEQEAGDGAAVYLQNAEDGRCCGATAGPPSGAAPNAPGSLSQIILKFTTVADGNEAPRFVVGREGAKVGRGTHNDICIPTDTCMGESDHASIVWKEGGFHVEDQGHPYGASIRIGSGRGVRDWPLEEGSMFSAGNSVFHIKEIDDETGMLLEIIAGPLKGERRRVQRDGATVGRATENTISIADRELSRHHSIVECCHQDQRRSSCMSGISVDGQIDEGDGGIVGSTIPRDAPLDGSGSGREEQALSSAGGAQTADGVVRPDFYLCDVGSTNGTYVQLVGPYASSRRLELSDHILIGRTGFSINRFDWGVWEDRGERRAMEDKSVVIQDMGVESLTSLGLGPQTFLAVYDGHGGAEASAFLWQRLHVAIAEVLERATPRIAAALQQDRAAEREVAFGSGGGSEAMPCADRDALEMKEFGSGSGSGSGSGLGSGSGAGGGWTPPAEFLSSGKAGARSPAILPRSSSRSALAGDVAGVDAPAAEERPPSSEAGGVRAQGLWWGQDPAGAAASAAAREGSWPRSYDNPPSAPSLPAEWWSGAQATADAARNGGTAASTADGQEQTATDSPPRNGADSRATAAPGGSGGTGVDRENDGDEANPAGGEAANGVHTERDSAGGEQGGSDGGGHGAVQMTPALAPAPAALEDEEGRCNSGVASPPPPSGSRSGAQSPGGGPSRSLATAGLPAEGGGSGSRKYGSRQEKMKMSTAVDRVIDDVVSKAFLATDEEFLTTASKPACGSTATTAMILGDRFYSFNLGDSRTILCRAGRPELVSEDHKPDRDDETERIKRAGGMVIRKRVMGELAVSRAFGDRAFKMGINAILREEREAQEHEMATRQAEDGAAMAVESSESGASSNAATDEDAPASTADRNRLTMARGSMRSISSSQIVQAAAAAAASLPAPNANSPAPPVGAPAEVPTPPAVAPTPPPAPAPVRAPVTDSTGALITAQPEMLSCRITAEDEFVLLACDGLFDVFSSEEVVQIVREEMRKHGDTQRVCETLTRTAIDERYTLDNVSVVLVVLKKFW